MITNYKTVYSKSFFFLLIAWGILNLFQAGLTPLDNDEAYYWMYSKYLAWGYYDHPPMIALMIKIGTLFFHKELGVRFMVVISQLAALMVIWQLTDREQRDKAGSVLLFYMLVAMIPVYTLYGFISTPDAPLILFSAIFFLAYKKFLEKESWENTVFLGLSMAALVYSKYHGALLLLFVILSNLKLLKSPKFYLSGILALILFSPHLFWQFSNGFPSIKYHLVERVSAFRFRHVPDYIGSQIFFNNPLILAVLIWIMIKVKSKNLFEKALYYTIIGFFGFFFISSFRYRVEPQWTALLCIPMLVLMFNNISYKPWISGYIKRVTYVLFPLFLIARSGAAFDYLPLSFLKKEFHNKKQWNKDISILAGGRPVVFTNSYQRAAVYNFYTGEPAYTLDNLSYRKTQYDIWDYEERFHGKEVLYVPHFFSGNYNTYLTKHILSGGDSVFVKVFKDFQSLQKECVILEKNEYNFNASGNNSIHLRIFNPYPYVINIKHAELPIVFQLAFIKNGEVIYKKNLTLPDNISQIGIHDTINVDCQFSIPELQPAKYKMAICSETGILYDTFNSPVKNADVLK